MIKVRIVFNGTVKGDVDLPVSPPRIGETVVWGREKAKVIAVEYQFETKGPFLRVTVYCLEDTYGWMT